MSPHRIMRLKAFEFIILLNMFLLLALCISAASIIQRPAHQVLK